MKCTFVFSLLLLSANVEGQDFEGQISGTVDSIVKSRNRPLQNAEYAKLADSVEYAVVSSYVNESTSKGEYNWPFWYFHWDADSKEKSENILPYPTETGKYLLKHKYHISESGVSNGCMWQHAFGIHDSLMAEAIRKKYGEDFFRKFEAEASELDKRSLGLALPFIKNKQKTVRVLDRVYNHVKQLPSKERNPDKSCYLMFQFEKGTVKRVFACRMVFYVQQDLSLLEESNRLTAIAQKLSWTAPKFSGSPVDATVIYDMEQKELFFYRGASFF